MHMLVPCTRHSDCVCADSAQTPMLLLRRLDWTEHKMRMKQAFRRKLQNTPLAWPSSSVLQLSLQLQNSACKTGGPINVTLPHWQNRRSSILYMRTADFVKFSKDGWKKLGAVVGCDESCRAVGPEQGVMVGACVQWMSAFNGCQHLTVVYAAQIHMTKMGGSISLVPKEILWRN